MFQLAFGLVHDSGSTAWWMDVLRSFLAMFDNIVYSLISVAYQIIFNISEAQILTGTTIKEFYGRVQLIIGVFMIFKLSISIIQVVVNPELLSDKKKGLGTVITRIVTMLAMFTAIIPLNIPNAKEGSYNAYLNENGLLFGTLYSLQHRIISTNTIERLIFGKDQKYVDLSDEDDRTEAERMGNDLAVFMLKGFIRVNRPVNAPSTSNKYVCANNDKLKGTGSKFDSIILGPLKLLGIGNSSDYNVGTVYKAYNSDLMTPNLLTDAVTFQCDSGYVFTYFPIISTICGIIVVFVLLGFCVDIAIRVFKLAILRLIAPIPILSYVDPQSAEKGAFANYLKLLTTTYLDLFLRLGIIEFVMVIVQALFKDGVNLPIDNGANIITVLSTILIIVGLFYFVKMAPKFIMDAIGSKGMMGNVGLSGMLAAVGAKMAGGSWRDALYAGQKSADTQVQAYNQGKKAPGLIEGGFNAGRDYATQMLTGNDKMTYQQMKRGRGYLANLGITEATAEAQKGQMYALKDQAEVARSLADKVNTQGWNSLTTEEMNRLADEYKTRHGIIGAMTNEEMARMKSNAAIESYNEANTRAGKAESKYKDMQNEMQKWGLSDSYRTKYQARPNARLGDVPGNMGTLFSEASRYDANGDPRTLRARARGVATGVRNLGAAPVNSTRDHNPLSRDFNRDPHAERVNQRMGVQDRINSNIEDNRRRP